MRFKVTKRTNPLDRSQEKYYPAPLYSDDITMDDLAEEISYSSSMTTADVKAVLEGFLSVTPKYLRRGNKVRLGSLGRLRVTFGGDGKDNAEDVTAGDIDHVRISFVAAPELKRAVLGGMSFEKSV